MAFLVLLEALTPPERAVFLLREVFDYEYPEIAVMLEKTDAACRQFVQPREKASRRTPPAFSQHAPEQHGRRCWNGSRRRLRAGRFDDLTALLTEDVVLWADGAGRPGAATRPVRGQEAVARFVLGTLRFMPTNVRSASARSTANWHLFFGRTKNPGWSCCSNWKRIASARFARLATRIN